ncbi:MAG TPA: hypothetical protein VJ249_03385 [Candidatus Bathyarchaeia archaeon]|nr:hypothetical protein [Candidatus Bathyarchaeia archaeon]
MPSTIPSHIYTMIALAVVGSLLVATVNSYTASLKNASEIEQLRNLLGQVAAKGSELATLVASANTSAQASLQMPTSIGTQQYWLRASNDSSNAWIEGALGRTTTQAVLNRVYLPRPVSASGYFISGYKSIILETYMNGSIPQLVLSSLGG